jgi:Flp pilus assembly protein TadD
MVPVAKTCFAKSRARYAPPLIALFLGCTALTAPAHAWSLFGGDAKTQTAKDSSTAKDAKPAPAEGLEDSIRQARMLRLAGSYPEAIKHLSQMMLVAADDARVVSEYGKTLAAMGRAQESVNFLTRAQQLEPTDWTNYSALGVAYDQLGNQKEAAIAYDHALALKPGEPSVLSNYALSRLLAKDPEGARKLAARAQSAGGAGDPMIARNIAMVKDVAPQDEQAIAANTPAPVAQTAARVAPPSAAPRPLMAAPVASVAMNNMAVIDAPPQARLPDNRVVMQAVPIDPLAGPVVKLHMPAPRKIAHDEPQTSMAAAAAQAASPLPVKPAAKAGVKTASSQAEDLQARAEAIAKTLTNKPAAIAAAKAEANAPVATTAPRTLQPAPRAEAARTPNAPTAEKPKVAETAKPVPAKPAPKAVAKAKDSIPGLRMSANAY